MLMSKKGWILTKKNQKIVQAWLPEVDFFSHMPINRTESDVDVYFGVSKMQVLHPILWKLAKRIELATQLKTTNQWSATPMQVCIV